MIPIIILTAILTIVSFVFDKQKTKKAVKKGVMMFMKILPTLLSVIIVVSVVLYLVSDELLIEYLGNEAGLGAYVSAAVIGSISIIPGFIAYPLASILLKTGVSFSVLSVFITTLKMVGVLTIPIEAKFFGFKTAIIRNTLSFVGAILVGGTMALIYHYY
ncbi:MAG: hypothetical protein B6I18_07330 [Bacteroidetes bacterium 4572_112]|nr:MAG: hypothetical protein B6I18_07330 [Bacteroidetes bacterium 4572_112]